MTYPIMHISRMAWPADWEEIYGRKAPLILEVGFGTADYLVRLAQDRPNCNVLGLEISLPSLRRGVKKMRSAGLSNLRILQSDSQAALWLLFEREALSEVFINFPDPWPKERHHHRRLINERFLTLLGTRVGHGATLDIATDHAEYAAVINQCLERSPYFENRLPEPFHTSNKPLLHTKYEKIALSEGRTCYYFRYQRNSEIISEEFPFLEENPLPHVVLNSPTKLNELGRKFRPFQVEEGDIHLKFLDLYQSVRDEVLLVEIYVTEEPYHQHVCLAIKIRQAGDMIVSLHPIGFPRPTPGLHRAIHHLVQWIAAVDPDVSIVTSTLRIPEV